MATGSFGQCSGCGQRIVWIKTKNGKNMPCNSMLYNYKIDPEKKEKIVTPEGYVVTGETGVPVDKADGVGYISHFATCKAANRFRRSHG